jgi:hypothetical protein
VRFRLSEDLETKLSEVMVASLSEDLGTKLSEGVGIK